MPQTKRSKTTSKRPAAKTRPRKTTPEPEQPQAPKDAFAEIRQMASIINDTCPFCDARLPVAASKCENCGAKVG